MIYIEAAEQISIQQPLSEQWMDEPLFYTESLVKAQNPAFRDYMAANEARRMSGIMKRAIVTTLKVLRDTGIEHPDAIITGTSIGSLDYTERFLDALTANGEEMLSPTYFMQSTHNTVGSALAIYTKTHGYNTTYSHGETSFDQCLLDAWMQMQLGKIRTALVGGHDEMVESYFHLLTKAGYVGQPGMVPCSEVAASMLLNTEQRPNDLCELAGITLMNRPTEERLQQQLKRLLDESGLSREDIGAVMTGENGNEAVDGIYRDMASKLAPGVPRLHYKHLFGENFTVSALGVYVAAHCLKKNRIPATLFTDGRTTDSEAPRALLLLNHQQGNECSLTLLKKLCC